MSRWIRVTFEPTGSDPESVVSRLREAREDPEVVRRDGAVVWKPTSVPGPKTLDALDIDADRVLVVEADDTANAGRGRLYERVGGSFVLVDAVAGSEGFSGRDVTGYVAREHGFTGAHR